MGGKFKSNSKINGFMLTTVTDSPLFLSIDRKRFWSLYVNFEIENIEVKVIIIHCLLMSCVI